MWELALIGSDTYMKVYAVLHCDNLVIISL